MFDRDKYEQNKQNRNKFLQIEQLHQAFKEQPKRPDDLDQELNLNHLKETIKY